MSPETMEATLDFMAEIAAETGQHKVKITFHGGEPLQAGHDLWRQALQGFDQRLGRGRYEVALQSNLWLLDDQFCQLLAEYKVEIGTSLDGPEEITDHQRGQGYFARTMQGIQKANCYGVNVGCIATFTPYRASRWREVFDFFLAERLNFSIHAAVPPLDVQDGQYAISPEQYGTLLCEMLDYYVEHRREISVSSLDQMCQGFGCGDGKVCTFRDCLGMFLAIDPHGDIFPCQRFCGRPAYRLGKLADQPTLADLLDSPVARRMAEQQSRCDPPARAATISTTAGRLPVQCLGRCERPPGTVPIFVRRKWDCPLAPVKDPYCTAYKQTFDKIVQQATVEMASEENIEAVAARPYNGKGHPLLKKGPLIELIREGPHPSKIARTAKRIVAAVELARGQDGKGQVQFVRSTLRAVPANWTCPLSEAHLNAVAARLVGMGICRTQQSAEASLAALQRDLQPKPGLLNNLYLHVTFGCQLHCTHCYARADAAGDSRGLMGVDEVLSLVRQAAEAGFRQVIITGGEPLVHPQRDELLSQLAEFRAIPLSIRERAGVRATELPLPPGEGRGVRACVRPNLVLRTNFAMLLDSDALQAIALGFDQVVVSVNGTSEAHDQRRGAGSYAATLNNLEAYAAMQQSSRHTPCAVRLAVPAADSFRSQSLLADGTRSVPATLPPAELSLATVMGASDLADEPGDSVRSLAQRLGIRRTRFRPLLPLGRAADWERTTSFGDLGRAR